MTYCPECNSEISEIDTFCAYCGIAVNVKPPVEEQAETDISEAKISIDPKEDSAETPWMSTAEAVALSKSPAVAEEAEQETPPIDEAAQPSATESLFDAANAEEEAFANADTELAEFPVIPIDERPSIARAESGEEVAPPLAAEFADTLYEPEPETTLEPTPVLQDFSVNPAPLSELANQEEVTSTEFVEKAPENGLDFVETVPYVSADFAKHNLKADERFDTEPAPIEPGPSAQALEPASDVALSFSEDEADAALSAISNEPAPEPQTDAPSSAEIATAVAAGAASLSIGMQSGEEQKKEPAKAEDEAVPVPSSDLGQEPRSFTDPNLNISDTDGKKAKLKPLADGTVLNNRYEIVRKIGGGGMGAVYLANDRNLGGVLRAVKEMVQSYIEEDQQEKAVNDFKRESMLLTSLDHSAIPTIFDYFYDEKEARFYLVMKYISGGDLASRLRSTPEGKINEITVTEWAIQIADVLDYLHNHQPPIVYRDLKPSNIMVDGNSGRVMLIDFGIARWVNKEEKGVTAVGTMGYAPPELFSGNVEPRSDIYSLGSTMFHLLTGADPQSNPLLIFDFNKNPRPRQINSQLTDQIEQILMRTVEYNADKRFTSASELKNSLIQHLENLKQGSVSFGVIDTASGVQPLSSVPVFCGFCGQKIVASDLFCPFCGAQQPIAQQQAATLQPQAVYAPQAQAQPTAKLMVIGTSDLERSEFTLDKDSNLVGRRDPMSNIFPEIDLSKFDPQTKVSRRHARIWKDSGRYMVEDLGSSNGTVLMNPNAVPTRLLPHQPKALASGDKIKVGDTTLHFVTG